MAKISSGHKRRQKQLKRKKKPLNTSIPTSGSTSSAQLKRHRSLPRMSHVLIDFALLWLDPDNDTDEDIRATLNMAMCCWNIGTLSESEWKLAREVLTTMRHELGDLSPEEDRELEESMDSMIADRRTLFASDPRYIKGIEVNRHLGKLQIKAHSVLARE